MLPPIGNMLAVALIWGVTNPFIKNGSTGIGNIKSKSVLKQIYQEIIHLIRNWRFILPFLINQLGSIVYCFFTLHKTQLSLAVPVTNSLTFVITALTGWCIGEEPLNKRSWLGVFLVLMGTALCCLDKTNVETVNAVPFREEL